MAVEPAMMEYENEEPSTPDDGGMLHQKIVDIISIGGDPNILANQIMDAVNTPPEPTAEDDIEEDE